ncbi:hypothetical protein [Vibrio mimicus]|uniref:Uncharacterized protein n=1 Tax=Vibrio mimicus TaxID=674 RepID=A0A2J9UWI8_VIBMI|nr:hypothetical protein [Vibrio mimicus]KFE30087.1 hypothetical protein DN31_3252 [Vibrio mimicus]PNM55888.1 hypothetical protein AL544_007300 [Vibrio mimicus]
MQLILFSKILVMAFFYLAFPCESLAHSQSPIKVKDISLYSQYKTKIDIGNESDEFALFDIELNGAIIETDFKVGPNKTRAYHINIKDITPNSVNLNKVCSISKPDGVYAIRTRICTEIKIIYPKDRINALKDVDL